MYGHPLARVTDTAQYTRSIDEAIAHIAIIAKETLKYQSCEEYVAALSTALVKGVAEARQCKHIEAFEDFKKTPRTSESNNIIKNRIL